MKQVSLKNKNNEKVLPDFITDDLTSNSHVKVPSIYGVNEILNDLLYYKAGNTFKSTGRINAEGYLSGSAKVIEFSIPMSKSLANISTITVNSLNVAVRHADGGYLLNTVDLATEDGTIETYKASDNIITIRFTSNTVYSATNNIPISVCINSADISFN